MKVSVLQQHLADLARFLEASGAKTVAAELGAIRDGLTPFRELPLKGFAEFLGRAEAYSRGEVPVTPPKGGRKAPSPAGKPPGKAPALDADGLTREARELYDRVSDPSITGEQIDALTGRLGGLTKGGLVAVAEAIDLVGMGTKKKDDIVAAIRQRFHARKGATQRAGLIDRQTPVSSGGPVGAAATAPDAA
jgi:hypothetical protein